MTPRALQCLIVFSLALLGGCDSILRPGDSSATVTAPPVSQVTSIEPEAVLDAFVAAWSGQDYETMYRLLAGRSRELYPRQIFINRYTEAHSEISFAGVAHDLGAVAYQGATAVLDYDVVIESPTFGRIRDEDRTMRMIDEGGWKIAWSPMDIFDALSTKARLRDDPQFPVRANIYDRNGQALAEEGGQVVSLYVTQQDMNGVDDCLGTLALVTRGQINTMRNIFTGYLPETLFHIAEIDPERYQRHRESLEFDCGIFSTDDGFSNVLSYRTRSYYGHGIASHIVGYVGPIPSEQLQFWLSRGYEESDLVGRAGIENAYEEILAGKPRRTLRIVAQGGQVIRELTTSEGQAPQSVSLTIDRDLQEITAQAMADAVNAALANWGGIALGGAIVALDVNSGEVLAMASYPSFDPHIFNPDTRYNVADQTARLNRDNRNPFTNKAIAEQYTPGSVYKIVTLLAAASEDGIWDQDELFNCEIEWRGQDLYGDAIPVRYDWRLLENKPATGLVTMSGALATSCNPFFWEVGARLFQRDSNLQATYAETLGLGSATGIAGLGVEAAGDVAYPINTQEATEAINNAVGQGNVSVTALQMAQVTAIIANGGTLRQPYIVSHIGTPGATGYQVVNQPTVIRQLALDEAALQIVREGMCDVTTVEDFGTASFVFRDAPYTVCGKTGTAETAGQPNAWFVAYYPADDPQIAFAGVMANSREGSEVVAPMIRRILDDYTGAYRFPFPEWWQRPFNPLPSQDQALAVYDPE